MLKSLTIIISLVGASLPALAATTTQQCPQQKPVVINKVLVTKLNTRAVDSANASQIIQLIGEPCSCLSLSPPTQSEAYTCQWKGNLSSNRISNTLNITFEAGQLASITAITDNIYYQASPGLSVQTYK